MPTPNFCAFYKQGNRDRVIETWLTYVQSMKMSPTSRFPFELSLFVHIPLSDFFLLF